MAKGDTLAVGVKSPASSKPRIILSSYKGSLDNALLLAEINESPDDARMPFFDLEDG